MSDAFSRKPARVALMVDGENLSQERAGQIINRARSFGPLTIRRAYGNATILPAWDAAPGFRLIHSGSGKNAADILLCIDAMEMACTGQADGFVIAASDRDYTHLALRLRERGLPVQGIGEAKTPEAFRKACTGFEVIGAPDIVAPPPPARQPDSALADLTAKERTILSIVTRESRKTGWIGLQPLAIQLKNEQVLLADVGDARWQNYFRRKPALYRVQQVGIYSQVGLLAD